MGVIITSDDKPVHIKRDENYDLEQVIDYIIIEEVKKDNFIFESCRIFKK